MGATRTTPRIRRDGPASVSGVRGVETAAGSVRRVYLSPDDAKTDVILAAVTAVLGISLRAFVSGLLPRSGLVAGLADVLWIVALTALVPVLLARYRRDGAAAFGFAATGHGSPRGAAAGLLLAAPAAVLGVVVMAVALPAGSDVSALPGRLGVPIARGDVVGIALGGTRVVLFALGSVLLIGFLAVRSREGFPRSPDMPLTQLVRTIGLAAVGVALVGGLLRTLGGGSVVIAVANALALAAILFLTDRLIPTGIVVPRTAVVAPVVVVVVGNVFATGGLFRGDLLAGLTVGALATGTTLAIAGLAQTRAGVAVAIPLAVAVHVWPTCLSPLVLVRVVEPLGGLC